MVLTELITRKTPPLRNFDTRYVFPEKSFKLIIPGDTPVSMVELTMKCVQTGPSFRPDIKEILKHLSQIDTEKTIDQELKQQGQDQSPQSPAKFAKPKKPGRNKTPEKEGGGAGVVGTMNEEITEEKKEIGEEKNEIAEEKKEVEERKE